MHYFESAWTIWIWVLWCTVSKCWAISDFDISGKGLYCLDVIQRYTWFIDVDINKVYKVSSCVSCWVHQHFCLEIQGNIDHKVSSSLHASKRPKQEPQTQPRKRNQRKYNPNVKKGDLCFDLVGHFMTFISRLHPIACPSVFKPKTQCICGLHSFSAPRSFSFALWFSAFWKRKWNVLVFGLQYFDLINLISRLSN